jgi:LysR family glycine cleavage system transcriptional activator
MSLPPLNALRAFEATARHLSFTRAADELHVTPAALSHQIKGLEEFLGLKLFHRRPRAIELTDAGRRIYPGLHQGFVQIRQAIASLDRLRNDRVLVVSAPPGVTAKWLAPRLHRFLATVGDIDARISSTMAMADFTTDGVDVAIRNLILGAPVDPELVTVKLADIVMLPVASPRLLAERGPLVSPAQLAELPLIHDDSLAGRPMIPTWPDWFEAAGFPLADASRGLRFSSADHAIEAAGEGAGVLLAYSLLAHDDLRTGRLVAPFDIALATNRAFHFVCPKTIEHRPKVRAFRDWLISEIERLGPLRKATREWSQSAHRGQPL